MGIVGNIFLHACCAAVGMVCHTWFLKNYVFHKCCAKVLYITLLLLSVEQSDKARAGYVPCMSNMIMQHVISARS